MRQKLNLITLGVKNFQRSLDFYEKGLGWKKSSASLEDLALFPLGGIVLALHPREELAKDAGLPDANAKGFLGITLSFNAKSEQEVNQVIEQVRSLGAKIIKEPQKVFWGGYSSYFEDLDGHLIEVAHNPFWPLDENDNVVLPE
ncbi:glyoxalase [Leptospira perolatii]|uniref:Glyoxalase n=1 Tax=Leptospira perolatii TaxID=2023191 RepID=A0A2M9ZIA4_9LEPT|nr:VOC family protein [Leptospira perolatii]PJZ68121.1 glyoxalase [Leptospira perolatii]PJZ71742.1 glyoxalase [Leptospira perolatii]